MSKKQSEEKIKQTISELEKFGISYDNSFCNSHSGYVMHVWLKDDFKCNLYSTTQSWVPFGKTKGISGKGIESLFDFLSLGIIQPKEKQKSYKEKLDIAIDVLLQVRDERNFDIIDKALDDIS